jgi:hypothetical protein
MSPEPEKNDTQNAEQHKAINQLIDCGMGMGDWAWGFHQTACGACSLDQRQLSTDKEIYVNNLIYCLALLSDTDRTSVQGTSFGIHRENHQEASR